MILHCPKHDHQVAHVICVYKCPACTKRKCLEYEKYFVHILAEGVTQFYLDKYGEPAYQEPYGLVRKRRSERAAERLAKLAEKEKAKKCRKPSSSKSLVPTKSSSKTPSKPPKVSKGVKKKVTSK